MLLLHRKLVQELTKQIPLNDAMGRKGVRKLMHRRKKKEKEFNSLELIQLITGIINLIIIVLELIKLFF